mmetsp:Transcript_21054/g.59178  ORF Transcript_21054/g.59178 Transcript_21054/m.59178 type:complete len:209 (+) Transcript_21054:130-756(+)
MQRGHKVPVEGLLGRVPLLLGAEVSHDVLVVAPVHVLLYQGAPHLRVDAIADPEGPPGRVQGVRHGSSPVVDVLFNLACDASDIRRACGVKRHPIVPGDHLHRTSQLRAGRGASGALRAGAMGFVGALGHAEIASLAPHGLVEAAGASQLGAARVLELQHLVRAVAHLPVPRTAEALEGGLAGVVQVLWIDEFVCDHGCLPRGEPRGY